jgi:hypothetical protein
VIKGAASASRAAIAFCDQGGSQRFSRGHSVL